LGLSVSRLFPNGTIVLTIAANIGDTRILQFDGAFPDSLVGITPIKSVNPFFLEYFLRTQKAEMDRLAPRGTQKNINIKSLQPWPIPLPPLDEQEEIVRDLTVLERKIEAEQQRQASLEALFKTLLHNLMAGKVRVGDLDLYEVGELV
jgi:type I restriction enzyme, S subunit